MFKFHSIWSIIAQKSSFGRKRQILGGKSIPETSYWTLSGPTRLCPKILEFVRWEVLA
jgi:hypothetical protein